MSRLDRQGLIRDGFSRVRRRLLILGLSLIPIGLLGAALTSSVRKARNAAMRSQDL
jgi:hypothetical protein